MTMAARQLRPRELTTGDLCALTGDSERVVQKRVAGWFALQASDPTLPRVRRVRPLGAMHWRYVVDAESYEAFCVGAEQVVRHPLPRPGGDAARARGCTCVPMDTTEASGAFVIESCPVHGRMFGAE